MPNPRCFPSARRAAGVATWLAAAALAGCASLQPPQATPGQTEAEVVARLGPPTGRYTLPAGGQRLEYATGPYGRTTVMVDLGGDGRVTASQQVLTEANFARIEKGWSAEQVRRLLGQAAGEVKFPLKPEVVREWRIEPTTPGNNAFFHVHFTLDGFVTHTSRREEPPVG